LKVSEEYVIFIFGVEGYARQEGLFLALLILLFLMIEATFSPKGILSYNGPHGVKF
jgi:hypothetical protein